MPRNVNLFKREIQGVRVNLDWRAYFYKFCEVHGEPVQWKGALLFQDGWRYSATSYQGPEFPPLEDPVQNRKSMLRYWKIRHNIIRAELLRLRETVSGIESLQRNKSVPLQQKSAQHGKYNQTLGRREASVVVSDVDLTGARSRLEWLEQDEDLCKQKILEHSAQLADNNKENVDATRTSQQ